MFPSRSLSRLAPCFPTHPHSRTHSPTHLLTRTVFLAGSRSRCVRVCAFLIFFILCFGCGGGSGGARRGALRSNGIDRLDLANLHRRNNSIPETYWSVSFVFGGGLVRCLFDCSAHILPGQTSTLATFAPVVSGALLCCGRGLLHPCCRLCTHGVQYLNIASYFLSLKTMIVRPPQAVCALSPLSSRSGRPVP